MKIFNALILSVALLGFAGCSTGPDNNFVVDTDYDPVKAVKDGLEGVKTSGRIGSNFSSLMMSVNDLKETDPAKAAELEKALTDLAALKDPAKIKAKAGEIISKY